MTAYTIDANNEIHVHKNIVEAGEAKHKVFFETAEQLAHKDNGFSRDAILGVYNAYAQENPSEEFPVVKNFKTKGAAAEKLFGLILALNSDGSAPAEDPKAKVKAEKAAAREAKAAEKAKARADKAAAREAKKAAKAEPKPRGKGIRGKHVGKTVVALANPNPRKFGTKGWKAYQIVLDAGGRMPYVDYLAAGGRFQDVEWDAARGWAKIEEAAAE